MKRYIVAVDQSTQGTKAILIDEAGALLARTDRPHAQKINDRGWVSHDPEEIYRNVVSCVASLLQKTETPPERVACLGISNQRETTVAWDRRGGRPLADAIVWQCDRAKEIAARAGEAFGGEIRVRTGIPVSAYFPAAKMAWFRENVAEAKENCCFGTVDAWLVYRMTQGKTFSTDCSNASRTQLYNLWSGEWDDDICRVFGIDRRTLPEILDSDGCYGKTTLEGILPNPIPICAVMGDSHAALFAQGCSRPGMVKATYGTGSSVMMNIGEKPILSQNGLATSVAWGMRGRRSYVLEGNINYTGAIVSWLKDQAGLLSSAKEIGKLAAKANPQDETCFVPAFSGLGAPHWMENARGMFTGISRLTGKAELAKAVEDSIALQIQDVLNAMSSDLGKRPEMLRTDGGAAGDSYLMQLQSDLARLEVCAAETEELSALGAGWAAGIAAGILPEDGCRRQISYQRYVPLRPQEETQRLLSRWKASVSACAFFAREMKPI